MCIILRRGRAGADEFEEQKFFKWKLSPIGLKKQKKTDKKNPPKMDILFL